MTNYIPKIPILNEKILKVAEIVEDKGNLIDNPLWDSKKLKNKGYTKQMSFEHGDNLYFFNLENYYEKMPGKIDLLQIEINYCKETYIKRQVFGDAGLDGLVDYATPIYKINEDPKVYKGNESLEFNFLYLEAIGLFLSKYSEPLFL